MATNVVLRLRKGESSERLIRRFIKKCKKERIVETYRERMDYYIKPAVRRKLKHKKAIRELQKTQRKGPKKLFR